MSSESMELSKDGPASPIPPPSSDGVRELAKQMVLRFKHQLEVGCGRQHCKNPNCASSGQIKLSGKEALIRGIQLAHHQKAELCPLATAVHQQQSTSGALQMSELQAMIGAAKETKNFEPLARSLTTAFSDLKTLHESFSEKNADGTIQQPSDVHPGLNLAQLHQTLDALSAYSPLLDAMSSAFMKLVKNLPAEPPTQTEQLLRLQRALAVILLMPALRDPSTHDGFRSVCLLVSKLSSTAVQQMSRWFSRTPASVIEDLVNTFQQYLTVRWYGSRRIADFAPAIIALGVLYQANEISYAERGEMVPFANFYNEVLNTEMDMAGEFERWYFDRSSFAFARYPFVLDPAAKQKLMQYDARVQMRQAFDQAVSMSMSMGMARTNPYLVLRVYRDNLIASALSQLQRHDGHELKKPLKVVFENEQGIDEGGVKKEFFQLIVQQIFDPKYGMFTYDADTRMCWFNPASDDTSDFELIGIVLGLAIYNSVILDVRFPLVVYKKLLNKKLTLRDYADLYPRAAQSMEQLLKYDKPDFEDVFGLNFTFSYERFGKAEAIELKAGGAQVPVTLANRHEYVSLYVDAVLNKSIFKQYKAFRDGFDLVCGGRAIQLFRAEELEQVICGSPELDFAALEQGARYEEPYKKEHPTIRNLWSVLHELKLEDKKKFLFFCTGSDRVPIKGLGALQLVVARHGPDSAHLPSAHTCFNHLLLPDYADKDKLRRLLLLAIQNSQGFGLM